MIGTDRALESQCYHLSRSRGALMNDLSATTAASRSGPTRSGSMVEFLLSLKLETMHAELIRESRIRLMDGLGCGLYGAVMPWGRITAGVVYEEQSRGPATIYGN